MKGGRHDKSIGISYLIYSNIKTYLKEEADIHGPHAVNLAMITYLGQLMSEQEEPRKTMEAFVQALRTSVDLLLGEKDEQ